MLKDGWLDVCTTAVVKGSLRIEGRADNQVQGSNEYKYSQAEDPRHPHSLLVAVSFSQGSV